MRRRIFPAEEENNQSQEVINIKESEVESESFFDSSSFTWLFIIIIVLIIFGDFRIY